MHPISDSGINNGISGTSVSRKTIEIAVASGTLQIGLAASPRTVGGVPGSRVGAAANPVVVADLGAAFAVAGPVAASVFLAVGEGGAVLPGAGQDVMLVGSVPPASPRPESTAFSSWVSPSPALESAESVVDSVCRQGGILYDMPAMAKHFGWEMGPPNCRQPHILR